MRDIVQNSLSRLGVTETDIAVAIGGDWRRGGGTTITKGSPIDGSDIASFSSAMPADVDRVQQAANKAYEAWRVVPAPHRGEFVRRIGNRLRDAKQDLATLVTAEAGKITQEALGEVQEMIDMCDFAVGLSRQLHGLTIASERPGHRLMELWHPLGPIGVITAFNFPVAVWAWNAMLAFVCGDPVVWKPSEKTPLCALACQSLVNQVVEELSYVPEALSSVVMGDREIGQAVAACPGFPLVSATGSVPMGRDVGQTVASRLGRSLLELGGNNALVVTPTADMELAIRAIVFSAVGTCGQRCTTLRRLIVHQSVIEKLVSQLKKVYGSLSIGNPTSDSVLIGPLIDEAAWHAMVEALQQAKDQGGRVFGGDRIMDDVPDGGFYVEPAIVEISSNAAVIQKETFAPILYVMSYETLDEAIAIHNQVPQGLASAIFTSNVQEAERFCSASGSDCGIVNVNIGTSGAEIGGAFGGEKQTGGGRESGSDAWKAYMRRTTNTINYSDELPLAQGIRFDV